MWDAIADWLLSLGDEHGVDPLIYAVLYVGAAPFFFGSVGWLIGALRRGRGIALPLISTAFFFSLPTLYVFVAGRNLPVWLYAVLIGLAIVGAVVTVRRVLAQLRPPGSQEPGS